MLYKACKTDLRTQLAHPKVAQPKLGAYSAPSLLLVSITHPARMPDSPTKRPGSDGITQPITREDVWACVQIFLIKTRTGIVVDITFDWPFGPKICVSYFLYSRLRDFSAVAIRLQVEEKKQLLHVLYYLWGSLRGVMAKVLDGDLEVSKFKHHPRFYVQFRTNTFGERC